MDSRQSWLFRGIRTLLAAAALAWTAGAAPANADVQPSLARLSPPARALVEKAYRGLDPQEPLEDYHVHVIGRGYGGSGCEVNPDMLSLGHPFKKAMAMMDEPKYRGRVFGDLSAITLVNRAPEPLRTLVRRAGLEDKLVNGTDYPLPGIYGAVSPQQMVYRHWITARERRALNEIARVNPLLFDFVLKRTLRDPATGRGLPTSVFMANPALPPVSGSSPGPHGGSWTPWRP